MRLRHIGRAGAAVLLTVAVALVGCSSGPRVPSDEFLLQKWGAVELVLATGETQVPVSLRAFVAIPGVELRADRCTGPVIAAAGDPNQPLTLATLGGEYPDGTPPDRGDTLCYEPPEQTQIDPRLRNAVAVRLVRGESYLWVEVWVPWIYNLAPEIFGRRIGNHLGDLERVGFGFDPKTREPRVAVYAQHNTAEKTNIDGVELTDDGHPRVYVAVGSHASHPRPGTKWLDLFDGGGGTLRPRPERLGPEAGFPGRWGPTLIGRDINGATVLSPPSPDYQRSLDDLFATATWA